MNTRKFVKPKKKFFLRISKQNATISEFNQINNKWVYS